MRQVDAAERSKATQLGVTNVVHIGVPGDTGSKLGIDVDAAARSKAAQLGVTNVCI
jgi:hypothetical protein